MFSGSENFFSLYIEETREKDPCRSAFCAAIFGMKKSQQSVDIKGFISVLDLLLKMGMIFDVD